MTPTSRGLAKRKGGRGSRSHVRATDEAATAQTKLRHSGLAASRSMKPMPQPAWQSLRAAKLERRRLEPHSRKPIHSVMSAMIAASDGMLVID